MTAVLVGLFGGLGAFSRFLMDRLVNRRTSGSRVPLGTIVINVSGALLLGLITGWWAGHGGNPTIKLVAGTGFMGGYTTFSTASVEGARFTESTDWTGAVLHAGTMLVLSVAGAALGWWLAAL